MARKTLKTNRQPSLIITILQKILQRETIATIFLVVGGISTAYFTLVQTNHIVLSATRLKDAALVTKIDPNGIVVLEWPVRFVIQNFGENTIKVTDIALGFQPNRGDCSSSMVKFSPIAPTGSDRPILENDGLVKGGSGVTTVEDFLFTPEMVGSNLCTVVIWQDKFGKEREQYSKIGSIEAVNMSNIEYHQGDSITVDFSLDQVINIFGPSRCIILGSGEYCL